MVHAVLDRPIAAYEGKKSDLLLKEAIDALRELNRVTGATNAYPIVILVEGLLSNRSPPAEPPHHSSASITVITRVVSSRSAGSGEPLSISASKYSIFQNTRVPSSAKAPKSCS